MVEESELARALIPKVWHGDEFLDFPFDNFLKFGLKTLATRNTNRCRHKKDQQKPAFPNQRTRGNLVIQRTYTQ